MGYAPPPFDLGFGSTPVDEEPIDAIPISFAHHQTEEVFMAQPNVEGRKAVKFAEPIVQGNSPLFNCAKSFSTLQTAMFTYFSMTFSVSDKWQL